MTAVEISGPGQAKGNTICGRYSRMPRDIALLKPLSRREIEILQQIADGIPTREIAATSNTSLQVIKNYTYRACQKLETRQSCTPDRRGISSRDYQVKQGSQGYLGRGRREL
jgi:DNA-binding NarL/FixJ family response regulator